MQHEIHKFFKNKYVFYFCIVILALSAADSAGGILYSHDILTNGFRLLLDIFLIKMYYDFFYNHHR